MNPHQYYPYQMALAPGIQGVPGQLPAHYVTAQTATGGMHIGLPPPPPPSALTFAPPKPVIVPPHKHLDSPQTPVCVDMVDSNATIQEGSDTESAEKYDFNLNENKNTISKSDVSSETVAAHAAINSVSSNSVIGGIYPAAYVQNAIPQVSTISTASVPNPAAAAAAAAAISPPGAPAHMVSPGLQHSLALPHTSKLVYLPSAMTPGLSSSQYYAPSAGAGSASTVVMDQAGRQFVLNNSCHVPMQYQVAAPSAVKYLPQQYVVAPPQYVNNLQGQTGAALQPMYAPVPTAAAAPGGMTGLPQAPATPQYYYYY